MLADNQAHWDQIYQDCESRQLGWFQSIPRTSLRMIEACAIEHNDAIIDVGSGTSTLAAHLIAQGYANLSVMDISSEALKQAREQLAESDRLIHWLHQDVTRFQPPQRYRLWHDRAVFHFLLDHASRRKYVDTLNKSLASGGHVIIATFAENGPSQCSGLAVQRYNAVRLTRVLGAGFRLLEQLNENHQTPGGVTQAFSYFHLVRLPGSHGD